MLSIFFSCVEEEGMTTPNIVDNVWDEDIVLFEKMDNTPTTSTSNQDRITDNVWITRGTSGGQIFNIRVESEFNKQNSPVGTTWARGSASNASNLVFGKFKEVVKTDSTIIGKELVMYLEEDDIYVDLVFTKWSAGKKGGFAYERGSK